MANYPVNINANGTLTQPLPSGFQNGDTIVLGSHMPINVWYKAAQAAAGNPGIQSNVIEVQTAFQSSQLSIQAANGIVEIRFAAGSGLVFDVIVLGGMRKFAAIGDNGPGNFAWGPVPIAAGAVA